MLNPQCLLCLVFWGVPIELKKKHKLKRLCIVNTKNRYLQSKAHVSGKGELKNSIFRDEVYNISHRFCTLRGSSTKPYGHTPLKSLTKYLQKKKVTSFFLLKIL